MITKGRGRNTGDLLENRSKLVGMVKADFGGKITNFHIGMPQPFRSQGNSVSLQEIVKGVAGFPPKKPAEVDPMDIDPFGRAFQ